MENIPIRATKPCNQDVDQLGAHRLGDQGCLQAQQDKAVATVAAFFPLCR